jgi:cysteinyl-tRNA synthetase
MLKIYNTIFQKKQDFKSIVPNKIGIYVCGVTVYDYCHIGHARTYLFFDAVIRYLMFLGYEINFVRNITDIDDKILNKAKETNELFNLITEKYIQAMHEDFDALNLLKPTSEPKATDFIIHIIDLIKILLNNKYAYIGNNGDVFYSVSKFKNYGMLSKRDLNNTKEGLRVEQIVQQAKADTHDFVLWKLTDINEVGWQSPWGYGRPGWHIECSAMSLKLLGNTFDIHGGGFDLIFPHHENEIAQSEASNNKKFVNYWMHVGFLQINKEKMSKSLGNFTLIRDILKTIHPEVLRFWMLSSHYRSQVDFSYDKLETAKHALNRLYLALRDFPNEIIDQNLNQQESFTEKFITAMNDDFNTPEAIAVLFELAKEINIVKSDDIAMAVFLSVILKKLAQSIGLLLLTSEDFLQKNNNSISTQEIEDLIFKRNLARQQKNWQEADLIRDQLAINGIYLEDKDKVTTLWRKK